MAGKMNNYQRAGGGPAAQMKDIRGGKMFG